MTRFAWVLNLDAEFELAKKGYTPPALLTAQLARHRTSARQLFGEEDCLTDDQEPTDKRGLIGRAWCPTPRALQALRAAGVTPEAHPSVAILRSVNHRRFACALGGGLSDQHYVETRAELDRRLTTARAWLLKRPLAFAGRGQLRITEGIDTKQEAWIKASLGQDGLVVEPLVTPTRELSLHGFVWPDGRYELGRICVQEVSVRGVFQSLRRAEKNEIPAEDARSFGASAERVQKALFDAGYFGPFGIDGYAYTAEGGPGFCALSEINARYTLGFRIGMGRPASAFDFSRTPGERRADVL